VYHILTDHLISELEKCNAQLSFYSLISAFSGRKDPFSSYK